MAPTKTTKPAVTPPRPRHKWPVVLLVTLASVVVLLFATVGIVRHIYYQNLKPVNASQRTQQVTVPEGATAHEIAVSLKKAGVIRSTWAFEWYVRNNDVRDQLQAGTYEFRPSQSVSEIVNVLTQGKIATNLITILPDQRLDQIRKSLINYGFSAQSVDAALEPTQYADHPALADKPAGASLEGYLYPESFEKTADTQPQTIVRASLDQMAQHLTADVKNGFKQQGLSVHQGITLASIVEREVSRPEDRTKVAQVFLTRIKQGMRLESDVTAYFGAIKAGQSPSVTFNSAYNTHYIDGLPPGPISNVTDSSLKAVAHPAGTDYLFFVSGDDGNTYFAHTLAEHQANVDAHCKKLCGQG